MGVFTEWKSPTLAVITSPFYIAMQLKVDPTKHFTGAISKITLLITDPQGNQIATVVVELLHGPDAPPQDIPLTVNCIVPISGLLLTTFGVYTVNIDVDGSKLTDTQFALRQEKNP